LRALLALSLPLAFALGACESPQQHVLIGQLYEVGRDCVDPTSSIDFVPGPDTGYACSPTCVVTAAGANGAPTGVYVTTACGPFPVQDTTSDGTEDSGVPVWCPAALAAFARGDVCMIDGTSSCPADAAGADAGCPVDDAGDDGGGDGAGDDGGNDAGGD
jgi:hypothetical protein